MKLINKARKLQNKKADNRQWILPLPETDGNIESSGEVLGLAQKKDCSFGPKAKLQRRGIASPSKFNCQPVIDSQRWFRSKSDSEGYFTLKNIKSGQLLTTETKTKFKLTGRLIICQYSICNNTSPVVSDVGVPL